MYYYISDTHFGHQNVLQFDRRPFADTEEMERTIIENWNSKVTDDDDVWIIGDFCYRSDKTPSYYLKQLKGHKHLLTGNHDKATLEDETACSYLESIEKMCHVKDGNHHICLCHFPIAEWSGKQRGTYHIYGHVHSRVTEAAQFMMNTEHAFNAGCMINHYEPVTLPEVIENNRIFHRYWDSLWQI